MAINLSEKYGHPSNSDNAFASKARFLQSWYRVNILKQKNYGFGPVENSKTKYGNILINGEQTGSNFLTNETFQYALFRTKFLKKGETINEYRLFNNMLSSQPMCFNLFYHLKALFENDPVSATNVMKECFPNLNIRTLLSVEIEYLPYPITEYLNDRTAFDAMLIYRCSTGERNILAIETKYIEKLGLNPSSNLDEQIELVNESKIFTVQGKEEVLKGFGQLGRNFLLAEKFRIENRLDKAYAVVLSPQENTSSQKEIDDFYWLMHKDFHDRIFYLSLEVLVRRIKKSIPKSHFPWIESFYNRYLDFSNCESIFKEYKKL